MQLDYVLAPSFAAESFCLVVDISVKHCGSALAEILPRVFAVFDRARFPGHFVSQDAPVSLYQGVREGV